MTQLWQANKRLALTVVTTLSGIWLFLYGLYEVCSRYT